VPTQRPRLRGRGPATRRYRGINVNHRGNHRNGPLFVRGVHIAPVAVAHADIANSPLPLALLGPRVESELTPTPPPHRGARTPTRDPLTALPNTQHPNTPTPHHPNSVAATVVYRAIPNAFLGLSFTLLLFSLMGIPPLAGFYAKLMVLANLFKSGYYSLALVAVLGSIIGAVNYLRIISIPPGKPSLPGLPIFESPIRSSRWPLSDSPGNCRRGSSSSRAPIRPSCWARWSSLPAPYG
jgi:hypothetical protein